MVKVRLMTCKGPFRTVREEIVETTEAAIKLVEREYASQGFTNFKLTNDDGYDEYRVTATTPGGRSGRNLAFLDFIESYDHRDRW